MAVLLDPKCDWAVRNLHNFPVEINKAEYSMLLRVPGIGVRSAQRIIAARRISSLGFEDIKKLGVVLKRARYFITCRGRYFDFEYLKLGWKMGYKVDCHLSDDRVLKVLKISQRVCLEKHRLLGFVRFQVLQGGIYYAPVEPDNNIVELLAPHFAERLPDQKWVIHDVKRSLAAVFDGKDWVVTDLTLNGLPELEENENRYRELWKEFFYGIAIPNRTNFQLQKRLMPVRHWKYMPEKW